MKTELARLQRRLTARLSSPLVLTPNTTLRRLSCDTLDARAVENEATVGRDVPAGLRQIQAPSSVRDLCVARDRRGRVYEVRIRMARAGHPEVDHQQVIYPVDDDARDRVTEQLANCRDC